MTPDIQTPDIQTPDIQDRPAAPPGRRLTQNHVRFIALAFLAASLLNAHLASPQTAHGQDLLRLLQMMTLLALVTVVVLTHRQGRGQHAALLTVPFLGVLYVGTVGADTLINYPPLKWQVCVWTPPQLQVPLQALSFGFTARHIGAH